MAKFNAKKPPSQRQLKVGEEVRHAISTVLMRNETHDPALESLSITVSEVRISPDLKNASVYVTPLGGQIDDTQLIERLNAVAPVLRKAMARHVVLKYLPKIYFKTDKSFETAGRINELLLSDPKIRHDVEKAPSSDES